MIHHLNKILGILFILTILSFSPEKNESDQFFLHRNRDFNDGWKFCLDSLQGVELAGYNDSVWSDVDLPHDWSIEKVNYKIGDEQTGIFSRKSPGGPDTGHVIGGSAWYRKSFFVEASDQGKIFNLCFDGVYMLAEVWVNGIKAGVHFNGYTPFSFDITSLLKMDANNVIAVKVRNPGKNSRWYSGSGIYRQVHLQVTSPVYIASRDVFVLTKSATNEKSELDLSLKIRNETQNKQSSEIRISIEDQNRNVVYDKTLKQNLEAGQTTIANQSIQIKKTELWSTDHPTLYKLNIEISSGKTVLDRFTMPIGIRTLNFSVEKGFLLNGLPVKIKGACLHSENGLLGAMTIPRAEERKIEIMKANGFNAIRTSHNPPSKVFLESCDKLGMLVLEEAFDMWEHPKRPQDYHLYFKEHWKANIESMVYRDRNHPSVIMWSIGNEIYERADTSGVRIAKQLSAAIRALDTTRPITAGICTFWEKKENIAWTEGESAFRFLDIAGYNYLMKHYESDYEKYPERIILGTESYASEPFENWKMAEKYPWVLGDFVWTGMDHFGESGIAHNDYGEPRFGLLLWPAYNSWCGDIDLIGEKKPQSYYRDVVWSRSKLEIAVHRPYPDGKPEIISDWGFPDEIKSWTWPGHEGETLQVTVYSRCQSVILKLNGEIIGEKPVSEATKLKAVFEVPYSQGKLEAIGIENNIEVVSQILETTGLPTRIELVADRNEIRADRNDLSFVTISLFDEQGRLVMNDDQKIKLTIAGTGELIASGNGSPDDMESIQSQTPKTFQGICMAVVRSSLKTGLIKITAESGSLPPVSLTIRAK